MTNAPATATLSHTCTGPNKACRAAHKAGRPVHVIPEYTRTEPALIMPTYHYATEAEGVDAITAAAATAPMVTCDDDLYAYRAAGVAHFLPVGWIDPTRR